MDHIGQIVLHIERKAAEFNMATCLINVFQIGRKRYPIKSLLYPVPSSFLELYGFQEQKHSKLKLSQ